MSKQPQKFAEAMRGASTSRTTMRYLEACIKAARRLATPAIVPMDYHCDSFLTVCDADVSPTAGSITAQRPTAREVQQGCIHFRDVLPGIFLDQGQMGDLRR